MTGQVNKRKDKDRIVLRKGESQRKDGNYDYRWTTRDGKRHSVYAKTLEELREKEAAIEKDKQTEKPAGAMVLNDGSIVTGKTSDLLGASASLILNAIKKLAGIPDEIHLISAEILEPICCMKTSLLGSHNPRLHSDEVLIALAASSVKNDYAKRAMEAIPLLRDCDAHFSVIISAVDYNPAGYVGDDGEENEDKKIVNVFTKHKIERI